MGFAIINQKITRIERNAGQPSQNHPRVGLSQASQKHPEGGHITPQSIGAALAFVALK